MSATRPARDSGRQGTNSPTRPVPKPATFGALAGRPAPPSSRFAERSPSHTPEYAIPKPQNTHAKRQREQAKKRKSEEKQQRRKARRAEDNPVSAQVSQATPDTLLE
jgi:hypothetical protein